MLSRAFLGPPRGCGTWDCRDCDLYDQGDPRWMQLEVKQQIDECISGERSRVVIPAIYKTGIATFQSQP